MAIGAADTRLSLFIQRIAATVRIRFLYQFSSVGLFDSIQTVT